MRSASLVVLLLIGLTACAAQHPHVDAWKAGYVSKTIAETTYQTIYAAYRAGQVSQDVMDLADAYYRTWATAQRLYVQAARLGQSTSASHQAALENALTGLLELAAAHDLL